MYFHTVSFNAKNYTGKHDIKKKNIFVRRNPKILLNRLVNNLNTNKNEKSKFNFKCSCDDCNDAKL